jgi:septal ring factor EnvC (AmiA/AmiB activator)
VRPSEAFRRPLRVARQVAAAVLAAAVAAALSAAPAPAEAAAISATGPAPPALYRARGAAAEAGRAPAAAPEVAETGAATPEAAAEPRPAAELLAAARREAIEAARQTQGRERAFTAIRHETDLLRSDADASRRGLDESRAEQERLLAAVLRRARGIAPDGGLVDASPVERLRAEALLREADPALRAQSRALTGEIARLGELRKRIDAGAAEEAVAQQALAAARERLADAVSHRNTLLREMAPRQGIDAALRLADTEREAKNLGELIKRAEAAEENTGKPRERKIGGSRKKPAPLPPDADPTRPSELRSLAHEAGLDEAWPASSGVPRPETEQGAAPPRPLLVPPVAGAIAHAERETGASEASTAGLSFNTGAGAAVVAPFDGRIVYAGPFRDLGRVLIIRHDRRYYSALARLGRVDSKLGDWVLAGEPVGAMADATARGGGAAARELDKGDPGGWLYYELHRDGRPVDPQPWLASVGDGRDARETGSGR